MKSIALLGVLFACSTATVPQKDSSSSCGLGTADHCGTCTFTCPGMDTTSTQRSCSSSDATGTCNIMCLGEWYDLDGNASNGCEAEDQPVQDAAINAFAITLPDMNGTANPPCDNSKNPCTYAGQIYSDTRQHDGAPTMRMVGREDWYKVVAVGNGAPGQMTACLGITNYPADNQFEVCIGNDGSTTPTTCKTAQGGGTSQCVAPPTAADSGTFYVKLRKIAGTNTANKYALYLAH